MSTATTGTSIDTIVFNEDVLAALEAWYQSWYQFFQNDYASNTAARPEIVDQHVTNDHPTEQLVPWHSHSEFGSLGAILRERWIQHFEDQEREVPQRKMLQKQESIGSLQEIGVGSFDHLSGLSLEQLQEMERMVVEHDAKYWEDNESQSLLPLEWLDNICA
ncbi:expressed unknown protein [Seminavis robusta]|uniref:Uncharacterized protein n=1 Tax=Seminavis robusta TaxID=568900 RepID=A0A9N8EXB1_9STRA|nr:expressed unknown protein [Seminavis robusta]|eukprot:Sro1881_g303340.1 n/a (162) ;mRNA; f:16051-16536